MIAYHVLRDGQSYRELGGGYFDRLNTDRVMRYHTKRLAALGYTVTLTKHAAEPPFSYYLPREEPGRCREAQGGGQ